MRFFVSGVPVPKGSAKAFVNKKTLRVQVMQTNRDKQKPWASSIAYTASQQPDLVFHTGPVYIDMTFIMPRPKSHYGTGKNSDKLKVDSPNWHTSTPDLDKLVRCIKDSLTGVAWKDDSQVCIVSARKVYGENPGVHITVEKVVDL